MVQNSMDWEGYGNIMEVLFHKMNEKEITEIYETYMTRDFPPMERKPLHNILDMMEQGIYESLLVYRKDKEADRAADRKMCGRDCPEEGQKKEMIGYALVLLPENFAYGLLDYLSTFPEQRNKGYGSRILSALAEYYRDRTIMIESEHPADAPDRRMAERRIGFYQRNGALDTGVESRIFGVHYKNFALPGAEAVQNDGGRKMSSKEAITEVLEQLYTKILPDAEKRKKYLEFWMQKEESRKPAE